jgi:hypothetical protein
MSDHKMKPLAERLREIVSSDDDERGCQGREYTCSCGFDDRVTVTCGFDDRVSAILLEAASALRSRDEQITKLREILMCEDDETTAEVATEVMRARGAMAANWSEVCADKARLSARCEALEKALATAAGQFRFYEKEHLSKGAQAKAMTNQVYAEICESALTEGNKP